MPSISDLAIALRQFDYSETSQVLILFTREHGRVRAIAKGVKRGTKTRVATPIDLLEIGRVVLAAKQDRNQLAILTEWKQAVSSTRLRDRLDSILAGLYAADLVGNLIEDWDPHPELFDALLEALHVLAAGAAILSTLVTFQREALTSAGFMPILDRCASCGRTSDLTNFSSTQGGLVCRSCEARLVEKMEIRPGVVRILQHLEELPGLEKRVGLDQTIRSRLDRDLEAGAVEAFEVLNYHIQHCVGRRLALAHWFERGRRR